MKPRRGVLIGAIALLLCAGICTWETIDQGGPAGTPRETSSISISEQRIWQLETAFNSKDVVAKSRLIASGLRSKFLNQSNDGLRLGAIVKFDKTTFLAHGDYAQIVAKSTGLSYIVHLVLADKQWYIFETEAK